MYSMTSANDLRWKAVWSQTFFDQQPPMKITVWSLPFYQPMTLIVRSSEKGQYDLHHGSTVGLRWKELRNSIFSLERNA